AANDQPRGPIVAPAVVTVVHASIDAIVPIEAAHAVLAVIAPVVPGRVIAPLTRFEMPVVVVLPLAAVPIIIATVPAIFLAVAARMTIALCVRRHGLQAHGGCDQRGGDCHSDPVHDNLPVLVVGDLTR